MFTELPLGCWSSWHKKFIYVSSFVFHGVFLCELHPHTCPLYNVLLEVVFQQNEFLNKTLFVGSQSFISLTSFMLVNAVVSEVCELNRNKEKKKKKKSEIDYFQFKTFPRQPDVPFEHMYAFNLLEVPYTTTDHLKYTTMLAKPGPSLSHSMVVQCI